MYVRACTCCCHSSRASDILYFAEQGATSTELLGKDHFLPKRHRRNFSHVFPTQERPVLMALSCLIYIGQCLKMRRHVEGVHLLIGSSSLSMGGGAHRPGSVSITVCIFRAWFFRHVFICTVLGLTVSH